VTDHVTQDVPEVRWPVQLGRSGSISPRFHVSDELIAHEAVSRLQRGVLLVNSPGQQTQSANDVRRCCDVVCRSQNSTQNHAERPPNRHSFLDISRSAGRRQRHAPVVVASDHGRSGSTRAIPSMTGSDARPIVCRRGDLARFMPADSWRASAV